MRVSPIGSGIEILGPSWWRCLGILRRCGSAGEGVLVAGKDGKLNASSCFYFVLSALCLCLKTSAPATMPVAYRHASAT